MSKVCRDVHRRVHGYYKEALDDDVDEGVGVAKLALWEAAVKGVHIENQRAFSICVAKRYVGSIMRYRAKHVYPDQEVGTSWQTMESWNQALAVHANTQAEIDATTVLRESPMHYADVLRKHYLEGETLEEIARESGTTSACIRKRHERALKWARKHFASEP